MNSDTKSGSFSTFLEAALATAKGEPIPNTPPHGDTSQAIDLLGVIAASPGVRLNEVQQRYGHDFATFSLQLAWLVGSGLLKTVGNPGEEVAQLTELGQQLLLVKSRLPQTA